MTQIKQSGLFSAIAISVGSIVGSGWLFASYYASQYAGPVSILSWVVGAVLALSLALLLGEIATMYQETGLFSRLLSITHNQDFGFIVAIANWFAIVVCISSEAAATIQYLGNALPSIRSLIYIGNELSNIGTMAVVITVIIYGVINYWGIKTMTHANNTITLIKMLFPAFTAIILIATSFHAENFTSYRHTIAPYGFGHVLSAVVSCGIFYAFYGFSMVTIFAKELKNSQRNIPLALVLSILICLCIYILLQVAFIGAMPTNMVANGWHNINFNSPLAQLAGLLGIHWLVLALYADAAFSPSGTGIIYAGSGARMLQAMADDEQVPKIFSKTNPQFFISRTSLIFSLILAILIVVLFNNWQKIMIVVSVFQLLSCIAVPIAFVSLRKNQPNAERKFKLPYGRIIAFFTYIVATVLLIQCGTTALSLSLALHVLFFIIYTSSKHKLNFAEIKNTFLSAWSMFFFLGMTTVFGYLVDINLFYNPISMIIFTIFIITSYLLLINQKSYFIK